MVGSHEWYAGVAERYTQPSVANLAPQSVEHHFISIPPHSSLGKSQIFLTTVVTSSDIIEAEHSDFSPLFTFLRSRTPQLVNAPIKRHLIRML